ncbi:hypothetical protein [Streptomyces sp. MBT27]|uniref:hypothetical protein n=1 Tax=Streptomyces sp. MBT27 TaxID=1488356 RepID=UPI00141FB77D|nr:hypothetical protein [Streptomyces sp. MBT27]
MSFPYDDLTDLIDRATRLAEDGASVAARQRLAEARQLINEGLKAAEQHPARRVYLDCEFLPALTTTGGFVSIGLTDEQERDWYAVNAEMDFAAVMANPFQRQHIVPLLPLDASGALDLSHPDVKSLSQIRDEVTAYFDTGSDTVLYAYYGSNDLMRLHSLWDHDWSVMPGVVPCWLDDLKALSVRAGNPPMPPQTSGVHHALHDARHNRAMHEVLLSLGHG